MTAAAAFLIMTFVDGIGFTYGIISGELIRYVHLEYNVAESTIPSGVLLGFSYMAGIPPPHFPLY